ncbi:unnamed protein product [Parnassius apollo]|uniref:(apollo) hypothetical protein n=1 Tax=Parnassius apollo TaxID=110799 RepID=A0A8S3WZV4_PARAO|nr:unnamed protein product [Parnassius apollo]
MNNNSRGAFLLKLACKKHQQDISDQTTVQNTLIGSDDLVKDSGHASDKENIYFGDSDDSVKDPNFEITTCANKSSSSDDSSGRPAAKKRVRRVSDLSSTSQQKTQPVSNTEIPGPTCCIIENYNPTPSSSKDALMSVDETLICSFQILKPADKRKLYTGLNMGRPKTPPYSQPKNKKK